MKYLLLIFLFSSSPVFCQVTDIDGNTYKTEKYGKNVWMTENLRVTRFNNGDSIPIVMDNDTWISLNSPAYCYFYDNTDSIKTYGLLYNGFVVENNICPLGWHVPDEKEWLDLMKEFEKNKLQSKSILVGHHRGFKGQFYSFETNLLFDGTGPWWCLSNSEEIAWNRFIDFVNISYQRKSYRENGLSCRCVKD